MDGAREESVARAASSAGARMVEKARESVAQVGGGGRGAGAGIVWDEGGLVLTNDHVLPKTRRGDRRGGKTRVALRDGRTFDAEIVKRSRNLDLALLRLRDAGDLPVASVEDSDALRVGDLVYAIGHPWGNPGAVTAGIVGGLGVPGGPGRGRPRGSGGRFIFSDVVLAPGNSGGPLLNAGGEVVGINAMIFGRTALSVPSSAAAAWVSEPVDRRGGRRPRLGVGVVPVEFPASGRPDEGDAWGLVVSSVEEGGPAQAAGFLVGDVLLGIAGSPPHDVEPFWEALSRDAAVSLRVLRGGEAITVQVPPRTSGRAA